ncbi:hypothetical protein [Flavobacterium luteolum]|uniref:hypothetical protein n=1 Tax=Flavobacterium luteolum TaxID=3003259 RepID=UPI00248DB2F5|nr:hypothetical protein [Flavobacterium luteolum]
MENSSFTESGFSTNLVNESFANSELQEIVNLLMSEKYIMADLKNDTELGKLDIKNGDFIAHEEMLLKFKGKGIIYFF